MGDLHVTSPKLTGDFVRLMAEANVTMPVREDPEHPGLIVDAVDREVCCVDSAAERPDEEARRIAAWLVMAINTCGGFRAELACAN